MVTKKLATQFDGMLYLNDACTKIYEETIYLKDHYCNATHHFVQYGVTHTNNIFLAQLQLNLNTKWKGYKDGTHGEPHVVSVEEKNNTLVVTREIFSLPLKWNLSISILLMVKKNLCVWICFLLVIGRCLF